MTERCHVVPRAEHDELVARAFRHRGFDEDEARAAARAGAAAAQHGIRTHNAIKALHLDELFGSAAGGCVPGARILERPGGYRAVEVWDAQRKLGAPVAYRAIERCMELADELGTGIVAVDNAFHYLWGGGYVLEAARRGYIGYTCCTATLAEVVPFGGKAPAIGTNPHSWAFPTADAAGFCVLVDWATSAIAMGRVQQLQREGRELPEGAAVDEHGAPTRDPSRVAALLPFGAHKGYGLSVVGELLAAYTGGSLPALRGRKVQDGEKSAVAFYFQCTRPDAIGASFAAGRSQDENVRAVLRDILGHGNDACLLPGQPEAEAAARSRAHGGLLFTAAEVAAFAEIARACGAPDWKIEDFPVVEA